MGMTLKNRPFIVAFEGLPGSGKTTLKNTLFAGRKDIERIDQILPGDPQDDTALTLDDIQRSDYLKTQKIMRSTSSIVLLDRYYHSTLAYQYTYDKRMEASTFENLEKEYSNALRRSELIQPSVSFYIDTPIEESYKRKKRQPGNELWVDPHFLKYTHKYYKDRTEFHTINGAKSFEDVVLEIETYILANA
jgi:thymidylate kinase